MPVIMENTPLALAKSNLFSTFSHLTLPQKFICKNSMRKPTAID